MRLSKSDLLASSRAWGGAGVTGIPALISVNQLIRSWTGSSLLQEKLLGKPVRGHLDGQSDRGQTGAVHAQIHPEQPPSRAQLPSQPHEPEQAVPPQLPGLRRQAALFRLNQQRKNLQGLFCKENHRSITPLTNDR